jgi:hypothetical protein
MSFYQHYYCFFFLRQNTNMANVIDLIKERTINADNFNDHNIEILLFFIKNYF